MVNIIHKKTFDGNVMLKVDIVKVFDILDWSFILKVFKQFSFSDAFFTRTKKIIESTIVYIFYWVIMKSLYIGSMTTHK